MVSGQGADVPVEWMGGGSLTGTGQKGMAALAPQGQQQQVEGLGNTGQGAVNCGPRPTFRV